MEAKDTYYSLQLRKSIRTYILAGRVAYQCGHCSDMIRSVTMLYLHHLWLEAAHFCRAVVLS